MRNRKALSLYLLIATALLLLIPKSQTEVLANGTLIYVEPSEKTVATIGETFRINISIIQASDLAAWEFKLYYPGSVLNATLLEEGPFLKTAGSITTIPLDFTDNFNSTHGRIWIACTLNGNGTGASGNGTLETITFKTKSFGCGLLHLADTELLDSQMPPNHILHATQDGQITSGIMDVAVAGINPRKRIVGQGRPLSVNVTAANQGNHELSFNLTLMASLYPCNLTNIHLFAAANSTANGWGYTASSITSPGPTITVNRGDIVNLTLTSMDGITHNFYVDYSGDTEPSPGEPKSAPFPAPPYWMPTIVYTFEASKSGVFTYYCQFYKSIMYGTFIVNESVANMTEIGTKLVTLEGGSSTNVTFSWNTSIFTKGNYTLCARADPLPGETNTWNNIHLGGCVFISIIGDISEPFRLVDIFDVVKITGIYESEVHDPGYVPESDIDDNGIIDIFDVVFCTGHYEEEW
jgi:hypothetical protein